ncbi:tripartite-type tricarboxylate transporter receptor subunit TctC [Nocardioides albertanoniae]|uniref:Tripartite-type tricarboxylate transporter receptor subunit TctC n=1 Tax=Nocardioides albertanoniae TaxID=1175486 RepID=A0A543A911_9ACTN|nr:tripartite tricarboxylate transporter substrate binding protein [Nocardioides albertanoniae]TQL69094.1 tripartite-type tricarboxylate transporter receptor subunit TctC [Nocardioides albertanoniae]
MKTRSQSTSRWCVIAAVVVALVAASACAARSPDGDAYPRRPIQVVVPYPAGSGIDTTTRALADVINDSGDLGQDLQIVNRDGGGGTVGTTDVLNAKPDGYTIGVVPDGPLTLVPQTEKVAYDPTSATYINEILTSPILFVVPGDSKLKTLQDLVEAAKAEPGSVTIAEGPLNYKVPADQFEQQTDVDLKHVEFEGDQATTTALLGRNVDVGVMQLASALPQLKSGKIRALGVTSADPVDLVPDVPTFASQRIDIVWQAFNVVVAPGKLPDPIEKKLTETFAEAVASDEFAEAAEKLGLIVSGATPQETDEHLTDKTKTAAGILGGGE